MNINALRDVDDNANVYAAVCASLGSTVWAGVGLWVSIDGGANYTFVANLTSEATMGITTNAQATFGGGNIPDELTSVNVRLYHGTLSSTTNAGLLSGVYCAIIGDEIEFFRDAALQADGTYTVTGFLRGRRGSEYAMTSHAIGERFILVNVATMADLPQITADIGQTRLYKAVSADSTLAATTAKSFTNLGARLKPLAPVHLGGGFEANGDATLNFTRRTRISGEWRDSVDVPLGESTEAYEVEIWNSSFTTLKRTITGLTSPTTPYTVAQMTTDFGGAQTDVYYAAYQLSGTVGRGYPGYGHIVSSGVAAPAGPPAPSPPPPAPAPSPDIGTIAVESLPEIILQTDTVPAYWVHDNTWNPGSLTRGTFTDTSGSTYEQYIGISRGGSGLAAGHSSALVPAPTAHVSIVTHGAVAGGVTDNQTAIEAAIAAAKAAGRPCYVPPGTWAFGDVIHLDGVVLTGAGPTSILYALDYLNCSIWMEGNGDQVTNLKLTGAAAPGRQAAWESTKITVMGGTNFTIHNNWIVGAPAASIQTALTANNGTITHNTIQNSLADSIHMTDKAHHITVARNLIEASGDDGIACVSYLSDTTRVNNVSAYDNIVRDNVGGRGMTVVGGSDISYTNNYIKNSGQYAGMYIAQEASYNTLSALRILAADNTLENCGSSATGHAAVMIFSDGGSANDDIELVDNYIIQSGTQTGIRYFGPQTNIVLTNNRITGAATNYVGGVDPDVTITLWTSGTVGYTAATGSGNAAAWRMVWKWPEGTTEVKSYPCAVYGAHPGWYNTGPTPGGLPILLPDMTTSTVAPCGPTPGTFLPRQLPLAPMYTSFDYEHLAAPTGSGHLSYDMWLQPAGTQVNGFGNSNLTHEIMIPLTNWGAYGDYPNRNPSWYFGDTTIQGILFHVYYAPNFNGVWKFIVFQPDGSTIAPGTLELSEFFDYIVAQGWANGTEWLMSVELGVEPHVGTGDLVVSNFRVWE